MKKTTLLLLSLFLVLVSTSAASYENLYLIGNATTAEWTTGDKKIAMTKESDGVFTWTGPLKNKADGDNGQLRFKFLVKNDWSPSITCRYDVAGHTELISGVEVDIYEHPGGSGTYDNAFQVTETGIYMLYVNLNTMKMTCTLQGPLPDGPDLTQLYIAGSATNENGNWDNSNPITMVKISEGIFEWYGNLYTEKGNEFKFINTKGSWANSINPDNDYEFTVDTDYDLKYKSDDKKFKVTEAGIYTVNADLNTMKVRFTKGEPRPDYTQLYIVGNATTAAWSPAAALEMTKISDGVFTWTGSLSTENGGDQFKFLNVKGSWSNTIVAKDANNTPFVVGTEHDLSYRPYESSPNDFKFTVTTNGIYTVKVNLNTMKMQITISTGIQDAKILPFEIKIIDGTINIIAEDNSKVQSVNLFDISGRTLSARNLSKGIYILKVKYNDQDYTQKVLIQK